MKGLLLDNNVEGLQSILLGRLRSLTLWSILADLHLAIATFDDVQLPKDIDDRRLWNYCQDAGWVLFTENRNRHDPDSLESTLRDSWRTGHLPILTLGSKLRFESDSQYADRVAEVVGDLLFGIIDGEFRGEPRIYVPR